MLPDFRLLYKARVIKSTVPAQKQTQRSMEQNREPRSKPCNEGQLIYNKAGKTWEQHKCPPTDGWSNSLDSGILPHHRKY